MTTMETMDMDAAADEQDVFQDIIKSESVTAAQGIFPEFMFFWRRRKRKLANASEAEAGS